MSLFTRGNIHPVTKSLTKPYTSYTLESHRLDIPPVSQPSFTRKASPLVLKSLNVAKVYNKRKQREGGWQEALDPFTETACLAGQKLLESFKHSFTCKGSLASLWGRPKPFSFQQLQPHLQHPWPLHLGQILFKPEHCASKSSISDSLPFRTLQPLQPLEQMGLEHLNSLERNL